MMLGDLAPVLQALGRRCWRKEKHDSQGAAEAHLRSLEKRDMVTNAETVNTYQCPYCGAWHVGHSSLKKENR